MVDKNACRFKNISFSIHFQFLFITLIVIFSPIQQPQLMAQRAVQTPNVYVPLEDELPHLSNKPEYVSSNECKACHEAEYNSWHKTYHRTMTQVAVPENVVGKFDGSIVMSDHLAYKVIQEGNRFWAEMPDPEEMMYVVQGGKPGRLQDIPRVTRPVTMTTGSHHYQTYWVAGSDKYGRLQQTLPLIYLIKDKRWIPRDAAFMMPPDSGPLITQWNDHCIKCHSTGGNPGLQTDTREGWFDTRVGELGIACEACHGPGEKHVLARQISSENIDEDITITNPLKLNHIRSSQVCGQCHGVFIEGEHGIKYAKEGMLYRPGSDLNDYRYYIFYPQEGSSKQEWADLKNNPSFFRERWWDDGTMLAGGREYSALAVTGCYKDGEISCLSCHSMHHSDPNDQLKPDMDTSHACIQCHTQPQYTTDITKHTHHASRSEGSNCLNCHMPHTTYALFSAIRNHQIQSPNISASIKHGTPNACNLCHLDQTLAWSQQKMQEWYGFTPVPLTKEQEEISAAVLWLLKGNAAQRVIAAWHVGWSPAQEASGNDWLAPLQARLLEDPYGVVRYVAAENLKKLPGMDIINYDFLADKQLLKENVINAVALWESQKAVPLSKYGKNIMLDSNGEIMEVEIQQLIRHRDNRPVTIKE